MTDAFASTRQSPTGAIRVAAPRIGDMLSGALHSAYDDHDTMPEEFAALLTELDRVARRPH